MTVVFILVAIAVIAGIVMLATGRLRDGFPDADEARVAVGMPQAPLGDLRPEEIEQVRIDQALRGYRMDEVDALIDRLTAEIAVLRGEEAPGGAPADEQETPPP
ncbi:MAG: DivIVA domain-containing protein [bacterium]